MNKISVVGITADNINKTSTTARKIFDFRRDRSGTTPGRRTRSTLSGSTNGNRQLQTGKRTPAMFREQHIPWRRKVTEGETIQTSGSSSYANVRVDTDGVSEKRPRILQSKRTWCRRSRRIPAPFVHSLTGVD
ncbi:uncharacterized protein LOC129746803 [Uranotaenia lowii]|uniref:uncharacterized protein LOC129746803 n=1 Tax=Uranotaenia lowii TaxID=190385 RepID=UPI00247A746A|nr:uncharacterized protein LOC129746803 [Uranotaenia lowii]